MTAICSEFVQFIEDQVSQLLETGLFAIETAQPYTELATVLRAVANDHVASSTDARARSRYICATVDLIMARRTDMLEDGMPEDAYAKACAVDLANSIYMMTYHA